MAGEISTVKLYQLPFCAAPVSSGPGGWLAEREAVKVTTSEGPVPCYIFKAKNRTENCRVHINVHGGGFVRPHVLREEMAGEGQDGLTAGSSLTEQLEAVAAQVKQIRELSGSGHPADQIASMLGMDGQQVRDILVCIQSFPEDDPLAVARLILLG